MSGSGPKYIVSIVYPTAVQTSKSLDDDQRLLKTGGGLKGSGPSRSTVEKRSPGGLEYKASKKMGVLERSPPN